MLARARPLGIAYSQGSAEGQQEFVSPFLVRWRSPIQIKIIVDVGQSEQSDRLHDQRRPQPSSGSPTYITERTDSGMRCTPTQTSSHPTNGRRLTHRLLYQMLSF